MRYWKNAFKGLCYISAVLVACLSIAIAKPLASVVWKPSPGTVTLSFDDGPSPIYTPKILDILKRYHVKATFFVMGWSAKKYPELIKRMLAEGHAVASHTVSHQKLTHLSDKKLYFEVVGSKNMIGSVVGKPPVCLRPPYGISNARVKEFIQKNGMIQVPMGFNSFDYESRGVNKLIRWVVSNAVSGRVFLLHDGYRKREQTVAALPVIIEGIRQKGLGFSAICYP